MDLLSLHKLLLKFPPEYSHKLGLWGMKKGISATGPYISSGSKVDLFGFDLDNPLGLAAGFDKNSNLPDFVRDYGFSFVEVGSVSYGGGKGNQKPRLFRLREEQSLLNRMGLNGDPALEVVERLKNVKTPYAINVVKTNNPSLIGDMALQDILNTYSLVCNELEPTGKLIYTCFNLSCPNTHSGKTFEDPFALRELLCGIEEVVHSRPYLIKISPHLTQKDLCDLVAVADSVVSGYIVGNTLPFNHKNYGQGGLSGELLRPYALRSVKEIRRLTHKKIIACGGIITGKDALDFKRNGADLFQAYSGFIYRGPHFALLLNEEIKKETRKK